MPVGGCVVDRQQLDDLHARHHSPVNEALEVAEVAHAIAMVATQREDGDDDAGSAPDSLAQPQVLAVADKHLSVGHLGINDAVIALFPGYQVMRFLVDHHIFILQRQEHGVHVDGEHPVGLSQVLHTQIARLAPTAQRGMAADKSQHLSGLQLRRRDAEEYRLAVEWHRQRLNLFATLALLGGQVSITIEVGIQRLLTPLVGKDIALRSIEVVAPCHGRPLLPQHLPLAVLHLVVVCQLADGMLARGDDRRLHRPHQSVVGVHQQVSGALGTVGAAVAEHHMETLAPLRTVLYREFQFHRFRLFTSKETKYLRQLVGKVTKSREQNKRF